MKWFGMYRPLMKLAHRLNWHYAPPLPVIEPQDWFAERHCCQWCGLSGRVPHLKIGAPLQVQMPARFQPSPTKPDLSTISEAFGATPTPRTQAFVEYSPLTGKPRYDIDFGVFQHE